MAITAAVSITMIILKLRAKNRRLVSLLSASSTLLNAITLSPHGLDDAWLVNVVFQFLSEVQNYCRSAAFIKDGRIIMSDKVENLEQTGTKKITISGISDISRLTSLKGITPADSDAASEGSQSFFYNGDINILLKALSDESIKDITITEPSLEEIFMNYYE